MKHIADLKEDDKISEHYLCKQKQSLKSRSGKTYLSLKLQDKTGAIEGKVWDLNHDIQNFEAGDVIKIDAIVLNYQNELQLKINKIRKSADGEYSPMDYIPSTDKDIDQLYAQIVETIRSVSNCYIRQLLEDILVNNTEVASRFKNHSAAKSLHHSYMGGLIEHTASVMQICLFLSDHYPTVCKDVLLAGAMLHDIGKVYELSSFPENDYTDDGQLLGHITIGADMVTECARQIPNFPHTLESAVKHCILAHHGEFEYGSPIRPKTIEAYILHCADNMDAKVKAFEHAIESDSSQRLWLGYQKMMGHSIRRSVY